MAAVQVCVLERTPSFPASMFLVPPSLPTTVWTSMSAMFVQRDFSGFDNSVVFESHLILTRLRHSSRPSEVQAGYADVPMPAQPNQAPRYLMDHCSPVSLTSRFRQRLHSASSHQLSVPRHRIGSHLWSSGVFCCQTNCLELTAR